MKAEVRAGTSNPKDAKKRLARELVRMYHGDKKSLDAEREFEKVFVQKGLPDDISVLELTRKQLKDNGKIWIVELLVLAGFARTGNEARRLIGGKGVTIDGLGVEDTSLDIEPRDGMILRAGKRKFARVVLPKG